MTYIIEFKDAKKHYTYDQDKIISPEETIKRLKDILAGVDIDILSKTRRIDNGRLNIPVFFSECGLDAKRIIGTNKQMGKGATPAQSEASAIMELIERFSFFSFMDRKDNFYFATSKELENKALQFEQIIQSVDDTQEEAAKIKSIFDNLILRWTPSFDLKTKKEVLIPFDWFYMINEFNGSSAGNCTEEALLQGICEIVERHTSAIVSQEHKNVPGIRLESFTDPLIKEMLKKYETNGIKVYATDLSLDIGIPTVAVLAWDPSTFPKISEIVWTAGTASDPQKAMNRALTETAQLAGDFNSGSNYIASGLPKFTNIEDARFITHPERMIDVSELPNISSENIRLELESLIELLAEKDLHIFSIDIKQEKIQIPAFYNIIPGTRFRERASDSSVGMFMARLITEIMNPFQALHLIDQLEFLNKGQYYTNFYKGLIYNTLENYEAAFTEFETALYRNPVLSNLPDICSHTSVCLKNMGRYQQAIKVCNQGLDVDEQRPDLLNTMGACHFLSKEYDLAVICFEKALKINPILAINYANIGSCYRELGRIKTALKYYEAALALDPSIEFARDNIKKLKK